LTIFKNFRDLPKDEPPGTKCDNDECLARRIFLTNSNAYQMIIIEQRITEKNSPHLNNE
jgi:hypothetical protein